MHQTIVALVRAHDKATAREEGEQVFRKLVEAGRSYDGYALDKTYRYDSEKGKSLLQVVFGYQTLEFNDHLAQIRIALTEGPVKSDDQLMENHEFRFHCWQVGESKGSAIRVYDSDAEGVQDKAHLRNIIEDWLNLVEVDKHKKSPYPLWVVSANAHY